MLVLFLLLLLLLLVATTTSSPASAAGDQLAAPVTNVFSRACNSTSEERLYLPNSTFAANLAAMSAALPKNASVSGFSAGAFGRAPDTAYGLALCRGDYTGEACAACIAVAFSDAASLCRYSKDVTIFHDQCHLRFYDRDFLAGAANWPESVAPNMNNVSGGNVAEFDGLVTRLANAVAGKASNGSGRYATGQAGFPQDKINLYGLAQCTPDLTTAQCRDCLAGIIEQLPMSLSGRLGGRILGVRCNYRYEKDIFFTTTDDILKLTPLVGSSSSTGSSKKTLWIIVAVLVPVTLLLCGVLACFLWIRTRRRRGRVGIPTMSMEMEQVLKLWKIEETDSEFSLYDFDHIADATGNFSDHHKLGQGGFGAVYRGELSGGLEVAIKRLSACSLQGLLEFKTEIQLIAKLQHTNLVRLLGCCLQAEEKMLIYEYMHNREHEGCDSELGAALPYHGRDRAGASLHAQALSPAGCAQGPQGQQHPLGPRHEPQDLRLRVGQDILLQHHRGKHHQGRRHAWLHRSGVRFRGSLLDQVRRLQLRGIAPRDHKREEDRRILPARQILQSHRIRKYSTNSNAEGDPLSYLQQENCTPILFFQAYRLWQEGKWHEMVDLAIGTGYPVTEVTRCLQVALLCVQDSADDRPNMSDVVAMLASEGLTLPEPRQPAYFNVRMSSFPESTGSFGDSSYISNVVLTDGDGR